MTDTPHTNPEHQPPAGPKWIPTSQLYQAQTDGRGTTWTIQDIQQGGRVIKWLAADGRRATTEASPTHPSYPTDDMVVAAARAAKAAEKEMAKRSRWYP